jgi:uncharacterized protein (TIGR02466 family)
MEQINLFSVPLYKFKFAEHELHKPKMMEYLNNEDVYKDNSRGHLDFSSPNLHKLPEFEEFTKFSQDSLNEAMTALGYIPSIQLTGLWATRHRENLYHHRHSHGNSFLAGVYYLNGTTRNSGTTFFGNNRFHQIVPARLPKTNLRIATRWSSGFEEGTLLIFPAWLEHETGVNRLNNTNSIRHILSFNSMPVGKSNTDEFDRYNYQDISEADMISSRDERAL